MKISKTFFPHSSGMIQSLLSRGLLTTHQASEIIQNTSEEEKTVIKYLVEKNILSARQLTEVASEEFGIPCFDLDALDYSVLNLDLLNEKLIHKFRVLPLLKRSNTLFLAVSDPSKELDLNEIRFHTELSIRLIAVESDKLDKMIQELLNKKNHLAFETYKEDKNPINLDIFHDEIDIDDNQDDKEDVPTVRFVHKILLEAITKGASDIHFEPYDKQYRVRFRIDGILYEITNPPILMANRISTRLKILAKLDISERRLPQDGRFKMKISSQNSIDFRISTCPTVNGEKIVMRILDPRNTKIRIENLGFNDTQKKIFSDCLSKQQGMILVTGPTGSGKTLTLYTALNILNTPNTNISTAEDPVEIKINGINQVQINPKTGLTFATALRAFLRQDPDVIMVGEMRDLETCEVAIKAAQTGHLVLSTLHTNSAVETLTRLRNIGIDPYNIANTVTLIISQRLVRKLCEKCKLPKKIDNKTLINFGFQESELETLKLYSAENCNHCTDGYKGRIGIFELLALDNNIYELILKGASTLEIEKIAIAQGMLTLKESGLEKIRLGLTTLEEFYLG